MLRIRLPKTKPLVYARLLADELLKINLFDPVVTTPFIRFNEFVAVTLEVPPRTTPNELSTVRLKKEIPEVEVIVFGAEHPYNITVLLLGVKVPELDMLPYTKYNP